MAKIPFRPISEIPFRPIDEEPELLPRITGVSAKELGPQLEQVADPTGLNEIEGEIPSPYTDVLSASMLPLKPLGRLEKMVTGRIAPVFREVAQTQKESIDQAASVYNAATDPKNAKVYLKEALRSRPDIDWVKLAKEQPKATLDSIRALTPWPGAADDIPDLSDLFGEYYETITGEKSPWYYGPGMSVATEFVVGAGAGKLSSALKPGPYVNTGKLTADEIRAAKKFFTTKGLSKMTPLQVRKMLAANGVLIAAEGRPVVSSVDKFNDALKQATKVNKQVAATRKVEKAKRAQKGKEVLASKTGQGAFNAAKAELAGKYPSGELNPLIEGLSRSVIDDMTETLRTTDKLDFFEQLNAETALRNLAFNGNVPRDFEIKLLGRVFGNETAANLAKIASNKIDLGALMIDAANLPRALLATADMSFAFRQGGVLLPGHPLRWAQSFGRMNRAFFDEDYAILLEKTLKSGKYADVREAAKLEFVPLNALSRSQKEEAFISAFAGKLPLVKNAERAYITMGNQLRANIFDDFAARMYKAGITYETNPKPFDDVAEFLNAATGRARISGTIAGKEITLDSAMPALNAFLFSPRLQVSRLKTPLTLLTSSPEARKLIAKDLVAWAGSVTTAAFLAKQAGLDVETDMRSSDFGKVKHGNTRYDLTSGYGPLVVLIAREWTGEKKSATTGEMSEANRAEILGRFLQFKLAPLPGLLTDVASGADVEGNVIELTPEAVGTQAYRRLVPLVWQDIQDAIKYQGDLSVIPSGVGAFYGVGVQTWEPSPAANAYIMKNRVARETFGKKWEDLSPSQTDMILQTDMEVQEAVKAAKFQNDQSRAAARIQRMAFKAGEDVFVQLPINIRTEMRKTKQGIGNLNRTFGGWTMNDERFKRYKELIAENIIKYRGTIGNEDWAEMPNIGKQTAIATIVEESKKDARKQVMAQAEKEAYK